MNITHADKENQANILNILQQLMVHCIAAMNDGKSFIISAVIDCKNPAPMKYAATFGDENGIQDIRDVFIENNKDIVGAIENVFNDSDRHFVPTEVVKKDDGDCLIIFKK